MGKGKSDHPLDSCLTVADTWSWASSYVRYASFVLLLVAFSITAGSAPAPGETYKTFDGLIGQLTCAVLCWLYVFFIIVSRVAALNGWATTDFFAGIPATVRFAMDLTCTMVCFIGAIAGAASINTDCILPAALIPLSACYQCPISDQTDPTVTDPGCKQDGGTPIAPYMCLSTCKNAFR